MNWIRFQLIKLLTKLFYFVDDLDNLYKQYKNYQEFKHNASRNFLSKSIVLESNAQKVHDDGYEEGVNYVMTKLNRFIDSGDINIILNMKYKNKDELTQISLVLMNGLLKKAKA